MCALLKTIIKRENTCLYPLLYGTSLIYLGVKLTTHYGLETQITMRIF